MVHNGCWILSDSDNGYGPSVDHQATISSLPISTHILCISLSWWLRIIDPNQPLFAVNSPSSHHGWTTFLAYENHCLKCWFDLFWDKENPSMFLHLTIMNGVSVQKTQVNISKIIIPDVRGVWDRVPTGFRFCLFEGWMDHSLGALYPTRGSKCDKIHCGQTKDCRQWHFQIAQWILKEEKQFPKTAWGTTTKTTSQTSGSQGHSLGSFEQCTLSSSQACVHGPVQMSLCPFCTPTNAYWIFAKQKQLWRPCLPTVWDKHGSFWQLIVTANSLLLSPRNDHLIILLVLSARSIVKRGFIMPKVAHALRNNLCWSCRLAHY